ncbi:hypothetical protein [Adlercreutzia sp. ZJ141]|uniref:hypothetical protein n=1 Tax=Adlercreutzia sp. ZJ141 TaxID=2709406 RepID=UPI0013ECAC35|nr:hypothetical protein [Adlercreutzia sp. ZJ141]
MEANDRRQRELPDTATEQQIYLEEAHKARIEAETKRDKQIERRASRKRVRSAIKRYPQK